MVLEQPGDGADGRRLARAVGAEQRDRGALAHLEVDAAQRGGAAAVGGLQAGDGEDLVAAAAGGVAARHELYGHLVTPRRMSSHRPLRPAGLKIMISTTSRPSSRLTIWPW